MATATEIWASIERLKAAKIDLAAGVLTVTIMFDGRSRTYAQTDMAKINAMILELQGELAAMGAGRAVRRGFPVQF